MNPMTNEKGLTFYNKNLNSSEFFQFEELQDKTFDQLAYDLWDRLRRKRPEGVGRRDVEAPERADVRQAAKFSWKSPDDQRFQPINGAKNVIEFVHSVGARDIFYYFDPIGGGINEAFERDAAEVVEKARDFGAWSWEDAGAGQRRLRKRVLDKSRQVVDVYIEAVPRYPAVPPRVITRPAVHDQCFGSTGELHWARAASEALVWDDYVGSANPLAVLVDELRRKYRIF